MGHRARFQARQDAVVILRWTGPLFNEYDSPFRDFGCAVLTCSIVRLFIGLGTCLCRRGERAVLARAATTADASKDLVLKDDKVRLTIAEFTAWANPMEERGWSVYKC